MFNRIYVHIPYCISKCPYCSFVSLPVPDATDEVDTCLDLVCKELLLHLEDKSPDAPIASIHFGGGTPSLASPEKIGKFVSLVSETIRLTDDAEITLEANPGTVTTENMEGFLQAGVNRVSLGIQSFHDPTLRLLGRAHTSDQALKAVELIKNAGFPGFGIDLMYGTPGQSPGEWREDLLRAVDAGPGHISMYALTLEEGTPFANREEIGRAMLNDDSVAAMYEYALGFLSSCGYFRYEISNFAKPGCESSHNSGYWKREGCLGLGPAAHGFLRSEPYGARYRNIPDSAQYRNAVASGRLPLEGMVDPLNRDDAMAEFMFLGLRMSEGVSPARFEAEFGSNPVKIFGKEIEYLENAGVFEIADGRMRLTDKGFLLSNQVFLKFLP